MARRVEITRIFQASVVRGREKLEKTGDKGKRDIIYIYIYIYIHIYIYITLRKNGPLSSSRDIAEHSI
jgi:hypothetical protein